MCGPLPSRTVRPGGTPGAGPEPIASVVQSLLPQGAAGRGRAGGRGARARGACAWPEPASAQTVLGTSGGGTPYPEALGRARPPWPGNRVCPPRLLRPGRESGPTLQAGGLGGGQRTGEWAGEPPAQLLAAPPAPRPAASPVSLSAIRPGLCPRVGQRCGLLGGNRGACPWLQVRAGGLGTRGEGGRRWRGEAGWECKQRGAPSWRDGPSGGAGPSGRAGLCKYFPSA